MNLFNKKKTTEEKFHEEKMMRALATIIRTLRDDKLNLPLNNISQVIIGFCDQIDPDHKMPERELIQKLMGREDIVDVLNSLNDDADVLDEATIKVYAEKYYNLLREILTSPDSKAWDELEYQSQQKLAVLSLKSITIFREHLLYIMESDKTCPFYVKKVFNDLMPIATDATGKMFAGPTKEEEKTAEEIMRLVCPGLDKSEKHVFRALVDSLKWRGSAELQRTLEAVNKTSPDKRKLRGRESCIFIEHEDSVTYVG